MVTVDGARTIEAEGRDRRARCGARERGPEVGRARSEEGQKDHGKGGASQPENKREDGGGNGQAEGTVGGEPRLIPRKRVGRLMAVDEGDVRTVGQGKGENAGKVE